jgi:hypothetical protein
MSPTHTPPPPAAAPGAAAPVPDPPVGHSRRAFLRRAGLVGGTALVVSAGGLSDRAYASRPSHRSPAWRWAPGTPSRSSTFSRGQGRPRSGRARDRAIAHLRRWGRPVAWAPGPNPTGATGVMAPFRPLAVLGRICRAAEPLAVRLDVGDEALPARAAGYRALQIELARSEGDP